MPSESRAQRALEVFFSYSHKDEELRDRLETHLSILKRQGVISAWHDRQIGAGKEWTGEINEHLDRAQIILLLVSADFLDSDYCYDIEMKRALERHESKEARVIPIILKPVDWRDAPFGKLQALPKNGKPITSWANKDEAFLDIAKGIRLVTEKFTGRKKEQVESVSRPEVLAKTDKISWCIVLSATIDDINRVKAEAIVEHLRELSGDAKLTMLKIESGSVRIDLEGTEIGFRKIEYLFKEQKLATIYGFKVLEVDRNDPLDPLGQIYDPAARIDLIHAQKVEDPDVRYHENRFLRKGAELILKALRDIGVQYIFGYADVAFMPLFDEMDKQKTFPFIMSRHGQGAVFMAQGLSRASVTTSTPRVGVCMVTSGPGAMNFVTGIADAIMDSVPVLVITGQVATGVIVSDAFQESIPVGVMKPITKQTYTPLSVNDIEETIHKAMYVAATGRGGPVLVTVPMDIQLKEIDDSYHFNPKTYEPDPPGLHYSPDPDRDQVRAAVKLINKCERPIILCGHGIINSRASQKLKEFAERVNIPIGFTLHGISTLPSDHSLCLGMVGMHGTEKANRALLNADLIIALGMHFDYRVIGIPENVARVAKVIHVEIDPSEFDKKVKTDVAIYADSAQFLTILSKEPELITKYRRLWFKQINTFRDDNAEEMQKEIEIGIGREGRLLMKTIVKTLSDVTHGKDLIVSDAGQHQMILARFYKYQNINSLFTSYGARMGCSLPMAIGVKLARPDERVWSISGDWGFQANIPELGTIIEHDIDINILLMNTGTLGMVRQWQTIFYDGGYAGTPMKNPDFGAIAGAYGIPYQLISEPDQVEGAIEKTAAYRGACMVEFSCDPSESPSAMIPAMQIAEDMIVKPGRYIP